MYRILCLVLFVLALAVPAALSQDAVKADPQHYKVESENKRVRVLRIKYGPHEKSVMHSHPDSVAIFLTDGRIKFTFPGGKTEERDMKAGQTMFTPAVRHLPENISDGDMEAILVEIKTPKRRPAPKPAAPTNPNTSGN
jgi:quercetin dioxygenase-like cupin family protein